MKFIALAILFSFTLANGSNTDADFASILRKFQSLDISNSSPDILDVISIDLVRVISFINYDCVNEKLGINEVNENDIYEIKNATEFQLSSSRNNKIITAILNAAKICSKNGTRMSDNGIIFLAENRGIEPLFPGSISYREKAEECFKWSLSQNRPNSLFLKEFDAKKIKFTEDECREFTAAKDYTKKVNDEAQAMNIKSCSIEAYGQASEISYNVMEIFLHDTPDLFDLSKKEQAELTDYVYNNEIKVLMNQITCIMNDLRN